MKQLIKKLCDRFPILREMFLYGIIGLTGSGIDTLLFLLLVYKLNIYSVVANCLSVVVGIFISFVLNMNFNFKTKDKVLRRFISFFAVGMFGLVMSTGIIALGEHFDWNILVTKICTIFIVAIVQYVLNKFISFKKIFDSDNCCQAGDVDK